MFLTCILLLHLFFVGHHNRGRRGRQWRPQIGERGKQVVEGLDENSPVIQSFRKFAAELDSKHDRHERLVKHSRDVTIESKRIIFLLHTIDKWVWFEEMSFLFFV